MLVTILSKSLDLKYPFTISRGTKTHSNSIFLCLKKNGLIGWGEASPNARYGETPDSCFAALVHMTDGLSSGARSYTHELSRAFALVKGENAAKAALDMAYMDLLGKRLNVPLHHVLGIDPSRAVPTSMTLPIDTPKAMAARAQDARNFAFLKVKLGGPNDRGMIRAIRDVSKQPIRVDANEGWLDREAALREIRWLAENGVELVEQPMPAAQVKDMIWLKEHSPLPLIADESFTSLASLVEIGEAFHGVNIKLQKCGGVQAGLAAISLARELGLKVMMGCMVESSLGVAAACQMSGLADYLDLDGHFFMVKNPFDGLSFSDGKVLPSDKPGLGMVPNELILPPDDGDDFDALMNTDEDED